ncbi:hypothetical protein Cantr_06993 [Candida viswanathii]|uniref:Uncharacterized protein n=1 Tax=Candida viswanathii TaxID=5486 RepID=A0A367XX38_9ASCO|nr:hypothetical protein Cantr_06993 [Candida viswanathii]
MTSIKIQIDDPSAKYFFHLAICAEIRYAIERLNSQSLSLDPDETLSTSLAKNNLDSLRIIVDTKLPELYANDCPYEADGTRKYSKIDITGQLLVGKKLAAGGTLASPSTEELLRTVNGGADTIDKFVLPIPEGIYAKLHLILLQALQQEPELITDSSKDLDTNVFVYLAAYFKEMVVSKASTSTLDYATNYFDPSEQASSVSLYKLLSAFIRVLNSHLEILAVSYSSNKEEQATRLNSLRELGNNLMANLAYAQAIKVYTEALETKPILSDIDFPQLYTNRAIAFIGLNCVPEAINDLNAALVLDRVFTPAWTQLGYCHLYMGNSLVALECYVTALKSAVGEILPPRFPQDERLIELYKGTKKQTLLPQFVKRLSSAIALTEKRAYQQHMSDLKIRKQLSDVRRILAHLRALGPDSDRDDFTYIPVYRDSALRDVSMRANSQRPNILTPEVTQNLLARSGMEASPVETFRRRSDVRQNMGPPSDEEGESSFEINFNRAMPNPVNFAEIFRSRSRTGPNNNAGNNTASRTSETERNTEINRSRGTSETRRAEGAEAQTGPATTQPGGDGTNRRIVVETTTTTPGAGIGATIANVISQAFAGNDNDRGEGGPGANIAQIILDQMQHAVPDGILRVVNDNGRVSVNNVPVNAQTANNNTQSRGSNSNNSTNPSTDNDIEMGDVPDLD